MKKTVKVTVVEDKKNKGKVIGRVFAGHNVVGKIVFFQGKKKKFPSVGDTVLLEEFQDRGRFLTASKWRVETAKDLYPKMAEAMEGRIKRGRGESFKQSTVALVGSANGRIEYATNLFIGTPLQCLEFGIKDRQGDLLEMAQKFQAIISKNKDLGSKLLLKLMKEATRVFEKGGGPKEVMKLASFREVAEFVKILAENPGKYPQRVWLGDLGVNGRRVISLDE